MYDSVDNGGRAIYNESTGAWTIPGIKTTTGYSVRDRRSLTDTRLQEFVELDIEMPRRTTPDIDDPNTLQRIRAILAMDLNDHMEEIPRKERNTSRQDKLFRIDDVSAVLAFLIWINHAHIEIIASMSQKQKAKHRKNKDRHVNLKPNKPYRPTTAM